CLLSSSLSLILISPPPISTLFPYTTLFRSYVLDNTMRLLHPFMPFVTEEIWQNLPHEGESITTAPWPTVNDEYTDKEAASQMKLDRKSTRLNSSHVKISYAVFCLKKKKKKQ